MAATYDSLGLKYTPPASSFAGTGSPLPVLLYFYHTDHLGSSSLVTTDGGYVTQHVEYVPFGEVFIEERDNETWSTPYKFNGKELDEETGLYYYGARYYDPRVSLWLGVDPLAEKYPNVGGYVYCHNNPVNLIDLDGRADEQAKKSALNAITEFEKKTDSKSVFSNITKASFVSDLRNIINNPTSIKQESDGTCGAAALSKYLAEEQPLDYVNTAIGIYQTGSYTQNNMTLKATDEMKKGGADVLTPVNTIMQGAITNVNNRFLSYNPNTDGAGLSSFTYPGFIRTFLRDFAGASFFKIS